MDMQPWRHGHNPLRSIWRAYYRAAVEAGAVDPAMVENGIARLAIARIGRGSCNTRRAGWSSNRRPTAPWPARRRSASDLSNSNAAAMRRTWPVPPRKPNSCATNATKQLVEHKKVEAYAHDLARQIGEMLAAQKTEAERFEAREKEHAAELETLRGQELESQRG